MAISREKKEKIVSELTEEFKNNIVAVLADYSGLNVSEISELRKKAKEKDVSFKVAKNNLFLLASKNAGAKLDKDTLKRPVAIAFGHKDEVDAPKTLNDFAKEHESLEILGGIIDSEYATKEAIMDLANLPSREELYAKIVGSLASPLRGLASVLQGNLRGLVLVLNQYKEKVS